MAILADFVVLGVLYFAVFFRRWRRKGGRSLLVNTMMYVYIAFVLYFTLVPILFSIPNLFDHTYAYGPINLIPFADVLYGRGDYWRQVVLNVIMTIPFGFLLPIVRKRTTLGKAVLMTMLMSICIEVLQLFSVAFRATDITDVITNTLGGLLGYVTYLLVARLLPPASTPAKKDARD